MTRSGQGRGAVRARPLGATAVLALGLTAACGGGGGTEPADYARRVCTAVAAFEASLSAQAGTYQQEVTAAAGRPAPLKSATVTFLDGQITGSRTLLAAVTAVPAAGGDGGTRVRGALLSAARQAQATFTSQRTAVAAADATDRIAFFAVLDTAQKQVTAAGQGLENGLESVGQYGDQALNDAFATDATCSGL